MASQPKKAAPKKATPKKAAASKRSAPKAGADDRSRQVRGQARKDQILATAAQMFAERGFRGTSIADLADAVGMTHPGLLYYFGTKERLLEEVVDTREVSEASSLGHLEDPSLFSLDEVARFVVDNAVLTRLYVVLASENLDAGEPLHDFFVKRYDRARRVARNVLAADQERGDVRSDVDAEQLGVEVVSVLMGIEIQWLMDPGAIDLEATIKGYLEGLRVRLAP